MKKTALILSSFLTVTLSAQVPKTDSKPIVAKPKLVIGIIVDQMRYDYIFRYWDKFGSGGFKRLVNDGFFCKNTRYNFMPTHTGPGHAAIYTGTTPSVNGIIANEWYDKKTGGYKYCVLDNTVTGVGTNNPEGNCSPIHLLTTTISDELRIASNMKSKVIGIALKDRSAIIPVGHTANAAYWYDGAIGDFVSSTYYMKELPLWVSNFNKKQLAQKYLSQPWNTLLPIDQYTESLPDDNTYETLAKGEIKPVFPHMLPELMANNGGLNLIRSTPFGNSLTKDFAIETIINERLGKSRITDFLAISFSSPDYIGHAYGPNSVEQEDDYLRLDNDIAELLAFIDLHVGKNNALIFLTADHAAPEVPSYLSDLKIPSGYVNENRMIDSLKKYLIKNYEDSLVLSYSNQQVFLDHNMIKAKKMVLQDIQEDIASFLLEMPEVSDIITAKTLNTIQFTEGARYMMQNGFNTKRSGDVLVNYLPGYLSHILTGTTHGSPYNYDTHVPLIFYGWNIKSGSSLEQVYITDIAATLASMLNIEFPNGCTGKPIDSVLNQ